MIKDVMSPQRGADRPGQSVPTEERENLMEEDKTDADTEVRAGY